MTNKKKPLDVIFSAIFSALGQTRRGVQALFKSSLGMAVVGCVIGFCTCYVQLVVPTQRTLAQREDTLRTNQELITKQQEAYAEIQEMELDQVKKWAVALQSQSISLAALKSQIHKQELALNFPASTYLTLAVLLAVASFACIAWISRGEDAKDAQAFEYAATMLPALREAVRKPELIMGSAVEQQRLMLPEDNPPALVDQGTQNGKIARFFSDRSFGFITPDHRGSDLFFHVSNVVELDDRDLPPGMRVSFSVGEREGKPCAQEVRILD